MIKQIEGNLQTLEALATIIGNNIMDMDKVMDILETENYQNDFIRMGFVKPDGRGDLVDITRGPGGKCLSWRRSLYPGGPGR